MTRKRTQRPRKPEAASTGMWVSPLLSTLLHGKPSREFDTSRVLAFADIALRTHDGATPPASDPAGQPGQHAAAKSASSAHAPAHTGTPPHPPKLALPKPPARPTLPKPASIKKPAKPLQVRIQRPPARPTTAKPAARNAPKPAFRKPRRRR